MVEYSAKITIIVRYAKFSGTNQSMLRKTAKSFHKNHPRKNVAKDSFPWMII